MQGLQATKELVSEHQRRLQRELVAAISEQVLQVGAEQLEYQGPKIMLLTEPIHLGEAKFSSERFIDVYFGGKQRRVDVVLGLEFDGDFVAAFGVTSC